MAYTTSKMRWRLLNQACDLAGSGEHADYRSVLVQIQADPHFERVGHWIEDISFLAHLDQLCDLSQRKPLRQKARPSLRQASPVA